MGHQLDHVLHTLTGSQERGRAAAPRAWRHAALVACVVASGCARAPGQHEMATLETYAAADLPMRDSARTLPAPLSRPPRPPPRSDTLLWAGFARTDITPPPGVRLFGYWDESRRAVGYRQRLYARAMVLMDRAGEKLAFVVADLGAISLSLHRRVAEAVLDSTGIGADRLMLAATHTHAGPGHYFAARFYNRSTYAARQGSPGLVGVGPEWPSPRAEFDVTLHDFLVSRIASAVLEADTTLRPARAAWGATDVWGRTRNRSYRAFRENPPDSLPPVVVASLGLDGADRQLAGLDSASLAVDPTWNLLRVDVREPSSGRYVPGGAFSIFAMHGTGNPPANDLIDADIHGLVARGLEAHMDSLRTRLLDDSVPTSGVTVHLFANGAVGDASPAWPEDSRCPAPTLRPAFGPEGPQPIPRPEVWEQLPQSRLEEGCLKHARAFVDSTGTALAARAVAEYDLLKPVDGDMRIGRSFVELSLDSLLCPTAALGKGFADGPADGRSRYFRTGSDDRRAPTTLQHVGPMCVRQAGGDILTQERVNRALLERAVDFPRIAQIAVVRLGEMLLGVVPAEITTVAWRRIQQTMQDQVERWGFDDQIDRIGLLGLANGYVQHVTTPEEFRLQLYEGASTLYGDSSLHALREALRTRVADFGATGTPEPTPQLNPIEISPGITHTVSGGPREKADSSVERNIRRIACTTDGTIIVQWLDASPGFGRTALNPADGPVLAIGLQAGAGDPRRDRPGRMVWDGDPSVEVRVLEPEGDERHRWEARWDIAGWTARQGRSSTGLPSIMDRDAEGIVGVWLERRGASDPDTTLSLADCRN